MKNSRVFSFNCIVFVFLLSLSCYITYDIGGIIQGDASRPKYRSYWKLAKHIQFYEKPSQIKALHWAILQYKKVIAQQPQNPKYHLEIARLYIHLLSLEFKEDYANKAFFALKKAQEAFPSWGLVYYYQGLIHWKKKEYEKAEKSFFQSQILSPCREDFSTQIAEFWYARWKDTQKEHCRTLLGNRFRYLNTVNFDRYAKNTLPVWKAIASKKSDWAYLVSQKESLALKAAHWMLEKNELDLAEELLNYVSSKEKKQQKLFFKAYLKLSRGDTDQAMHLFKKSVQAQSPSFRKETINKAVKTLVSLDHLNLAMLFLAETDCDDLATRQTVLEKAFLNKVSLPSLLLWLEDTQREYGDLPPYLDFIFSQCHLNNHDVYSAIEYAQKAFLGDNRNPRYIYNLYSLWFSRGLEAKVSFHLQKNAHVIPHTPNFYVWLSSRFLSCKKRSKALHWAQKALNIDPYNQRAQERIRYIKDIEKKRTNS